MLLKIKDCPRSVYSFCSCKLSLMLVFPFEFSIRKKFTGEKKILPLESISSSSRDMRSLSWCSCVKSRSSPFSCSLMDACDAASPYSGLSWYAVFSFIKPSLQSENLISHNSWGHSLFQLLSLPCNLDTNFSRWNSWNFLIWCQI